ncbi:MAG: tripartite tricarboxylate transporter TctB family protein [Zoogloeaceae bacterium]|jgi:putative tricarboxylic transport membrane protein|nr:tripartite tricarboxylate transporter TctB family protein [Zoogloeaceae bacterium]
MQNLLGGLLMIAIAVIAVVQGSALSIGSLRHIGPGMVPMTLAAFLGLIGVVLILSWWRGRERVGTGRWPLRGPVFILGAAVVFGLTVRPLGLSVAGPLLVVIAAFASAETRWKEIIIFSVCMMLFCLGLFRYALTLPIPVAPWLIGY